MVTLHTIVKNEERFIKPALLSTLSSNEVKEALVWDTGSTDRTVSKILSIKDSRIKFCQKDKINRKGLVHLRKEQIKLTKTPWILLVDGDEIWPKNNLEKLILAMKQPARQSCEATGGCSNLTIALVNRTRNAIGDIYHYLPESEGHYQIGPWKGHLNIRAIRNLAGLTVKGEYPNEWYEYQGKKLQNHPVCVKNGSWRTPRTVLEKCLKFVDTWYLHVTHLKRSNSWFSEIRTIDRIKKYKLFYKLRGKEILQLKKEELPESLKA